MLLQHAMTPPIILKHYNPYTPSAIKDINKLEDWAKRTDNFELFRYDDYVKFFQFFGEFCTIAMFRTFCKNINDILVGPSSPNSYHDVKRSSQFSRFFSFIKFDIF